MENLKHLSQQELMEISGGRLGKLVKYGRRLLEWAGVYDAIDEFSEGFSDGWSERRQ